MHAAVSTLMLPLPVGLAVVAVLLLLILIAAWGFTARYKKKFLEERANAVATIHELKTSMEKRVADRTAELASARDDLSKALRQERELGELKTRFITMVSHEFRTPLGITMSAIELMRHYDDRLPVTQRKELYGDIYHATRQMGGLMEQVLVLGRVESGTLTFRTAPLDLEILAQKLADESLSVMNRRCPIEWQALTPLEGARGDETLIRHIFSNLLSNAAKYSPAGNLVRFTARRQDEDAVLTVEDHGIGIPEEDRASLFTAFHRGSNVGEAPGTGLGLVIVNRCVDQHGGSLELSSSPGKGTTFTVRLPLYLATSAAPSSMVVDTTA